MDVDEAACIKLFGTVILKEERRVKEKEEALPPSAARAAATAAADLQDEMAAAREAASAVALPCPRCKSKETKFCYFNNYNVNQPRHFCKACHRYWTAGGTLRNVPVGAGRRRGRRIPPHGVLEYQYPSPPCTAARWLLRPEAEDLVGPNYINGRGLC